LNLTVEPLIYKGGLTMKLNLIFIVLMLLLIGTGCNKDAFLTDKAGGSLKSAELKNIPVKADIYAVVTQEQDGVAYAGNLGGIVSHLGNLILDKSTFLRTKLEMKEGPTLYWEMFGDVAASNGDVMHYTLWGELNLAKNKYVSTVTYDGGTGRFENVKGFIDLKGYVDHDTGKLMMNGEGQLSNVGSTK
jgi:hypothetical protein